MNDNKLFDFLIVGSGFFGSICAYELNKKGFKVCVLEKRNHIGGNCYTENVDGINMHKYGPHIFHTSNDQIWKWINRFASFNNFSLRPVANFKGEIYSLPFNMWTYNKLWNIVTPEEAKKVIKEQGSAIREPKDFEEQAIKLVGTDIYNKLIKGYTQKQWKKSPKELPIEIIKRLPVRFTYDNNYFNDNYQGIPIGGYTQIFNKLLDGIEVKLGIDYLENKEYWDSLADKVIYTGSIDRYYKYQFGFLEYKSTSFIHKRLSTDDFQGTAMMNFTDDEIPYTRIIEHKHFDHAKTSLTWITYEYPTDYIIEKTEPYYPVNDELNNDLYLKYRTLSNGKNKIFFGGRLAEYKYYDMHQVISSAFEKVRSIIKNHERN